MVPNCAKYSSKKIICKNANLNLDTLIENNDLGNDSDKNKDNYYLFTEKCK